MIHSSPAVVDFLYRIQKEVCTIDQQYPDDSRLAFIYFCLCLATFDEDRIEEASYLEESITHHLSSLAYKITLSKATNSSTQ